MSLNISVYTFQVFVKPNFPLIVIGLCAPICGKSVVSHFSALCFQVFTNVVEYSTQRDILTSLHEP